MATMEERVARLEEILGEIFRPGGTLAIRDDQKEAAAVILGDTAGDVGSVLMSMGLSVKEPGDERRVIVTSTGVGFKDEKDVLRVLITAQGLVFLDERGQPHTLINAEGIHKVGKGGGKGA